ncbi:MAG: mono/diheme cytochrome c family protein [Candidatus Poriferisodalaceae bacterium]|jgi:mono/diheme cytochrome c family protein
MRADYGLQPMLYRLGVCLVIVTLVACSSGTSSYGPINETYSASALEAGEAIYASNCSVCHGQNGEGGIGSRLTGIGHRLSYSSHVKIVLQGRRSMPAFSRRLDAAEISAVVAYQRLAFSESKK